MPPNVVSTREKLPDSNVGYLVKSQLDEITPLDPGDADSMGEHDDADPEVIARMDARIRAAKRLKYGGFPREAD